MADVAGVGVPGDRRLQILQATGLLDSPPEPAFDDLTCVVKEALDVSGSLVTLVDERRQFFKSQVGLPEPWATRRETPLSHSLCKLVVARNQPLVVEDVVHDPSLSNSVEVRELGVEAYLGVPLAMAPGEVLGALCAVHAAPHHWRREDVRVLERLAKATVREIEHRLTERWLAEENARLERLAAGLQGTPHEGEHDRDLDPDAPAAAAAARPLRILAIDDEPLILRTLPLVFEDEEIHTVTSARDALDRIRAGEWFDVILCDLMMPRMSGMDLHDVLEQEHPELARRMVFMTGGVTSATTRDFLDRVSNACVEKPFDFDALIRSVKRAALR